LLQGAYEAIALRPERILISEQLEVENPVKEGGTRAHDAGVQEKNWEEAMEVLRPVT
jgi:hypothetical protein